MPSIKANRKVGDTPTQDPTRTLLHDGIPILCGNPGIDAKCCYTSQFADRECKRTYGGQEINGTKIGYSDVFAVPIPSTDDRSPRLGCASGQAYECRADTTPICARGSATFKYNKDGPLGTMLINAHPGPPSTLADIDKDCRQERFPGDPTRFGNAIRDFQTAGPQNPEGQCVIADWKTPQLYPGKATWVPLGVRAPNDQILNRPNEPIETCCDPAKQTDVSTLFVCDPHTCFGKPACDNATITQQICSDADHIATDPLCVDTCIRNNKHGRLSWCNMPIQKFCQGKNLETEACRQYCSADNLDSNEALSTYCDNAYSNYCRSNDPTHDTQRKKVLCGCINSPLPMPTCIDANCTNAQSIKLASQRRVDVNKCPDVCLQNIVIEKGGSIDIDHSAWKQYCGNQAEPGTNPDNPFAPVKVDDKALKLAWYIGGPLLLILFVLVLVFVFQPR